ncbi:MAG: PLP-dependent aminotransferase family protein [Lachnospiraceae bacterium]|nr:PLP-dependent aminotransferase family protein [Lachnospiraceae bacterium]
MMKYAERMNTMADFANVTRLAYDATGNAEIINFALGCPADETLPVEAAGEILADIFGKDKRGLEALKYNNPRGILQLRKIAAEIMLPKRGVMDADPANILITTGGLETLNFVCQLFINKGDVVLIESPTFMQAIQIFKMFEAECIPVECDEHGMIIEDLKAKYEQYHAKMVYVIPSFQNPSGTTTSLERRKAIAEFGSEHDIVILEDDPYVELRQRNENLPSIKSFDKTGNVIFADSFSKCVAPGLRVGYVYADAETIYRIYDAKTATNSHTSVIPQMIVAEYFARGLYEEHIEKAREIYRVKFDAATAALEKYMPEGTKFQRPDGGLFYWVELPENAPDTTEMTKHVSEFGVNYTPGAGFFVNGKGHNCMRLSFGSMSPEVITQGIKQLGEYIKSKM